MSIPRLKCAISNQNENLYPHKKPTAMAIVKDKKYMNALRLKILFLKRLVQDNIINNKEGRMIPTERKITNMLLIRSGSFNVVVVILLDCMEKEKGRKGNEKQKQS